MGLVSFLETPKEVMAAHYGASLRFSKILFVCVNVENCIIFSVANYDGGICVHVVKELIHLFHFELCGIILLAHNAAKRHENCGINCTAII